MAKSKFTVIPKATNVGGHRQGPSASNTAANGFTPEDAQFAISQTEQAIAVLRTVALAAAAVEDGCVASDAYGVARWSPVIGHVCKRIERVRDVLDKPSAPNDVDCFTSLAVVEALDAAVWARGQAEPGEDALTHSDFVGTAAAAVECLQSMHAELQGYYAAGT